MKTLHSYLQSESILDRFSGLMQYSEKQLGLQKDNLFLWIPILLALGIGIYFSLRFEPPLILGITATLFSFSMLYGAWRYKADAIGLRLFILVPCFISVGFGAAQIRTHLVHTPILQQKLGPVDITGTIQRIEVLEKGSRLTIGNVYIEDLGREETPRRVRLKLFKDDNVQVGDKIQALANLNPPSPPVAPGAFDFRRYAYFKGIGAVGFIYRAPDIVERQESPISNIFYKIRTSIINSVEARLDYPEAAIVITLLTGERGSIPEEDLQAMRDSGLAHLLAISGLHVGMIAGVIFFFSRLMMACWPWFALRYPIKKYAALLALCGAAFYMVLVGATIPTQRALIMTGLVLVAIMIDRDPFSMRLVALAAALILLIAPESLMSVSFQMSFAAVVCLIFFYGEIRPVWSSWHRRAGILKRVTLYFTGISLTTVIAGTATALFALYHFQHYAAYGVLANLLAVPIMAFIVMPAGVLSFTGLESIAYSIMNVGIEWILWVAHGVADLGGSVVNIPAFSYAAFVFLIIGGLGFIVLKGHFRIISVMFCIVASLFIFQYNQPDIQISSDFDLISVRDESGSLILSSRVKDRFTGENWMRRNGQDKQKSLVFPKEGASQDGVIVCDTLACRIKKNTAQISWIKNKQALAEECLWADIVISPFSVPNSCKSPIVLDYWDSRNYGAHAVYLSEDIDIRRTSDYIGDRPWAH